MQKYNGPAPSVSARAAKLVDSIAADASALRCSVSTGGAGERLIDMGAGVPGGLEAGRRLAEVCMGGLGTVSLHMASGLKRWPLGITVHASNPVIACLGSQYAGWSISEQESGFFALGSGPARALSRVEPLYKDLGYVDHCSKASLGDRGRQGPALVRRPHHRGGLRRAAGRPHHSLRADGQSRRHRADRRARPRGRVAQGARAALPARAHRGRHRHGSHRAAHPGLHPGHGAHQRRHHLWRPRAALRTRRRRGRRKSWRNSCRARPALPTACPLPKFSRLPAATSTKSIRCCSAPPR